MALALLNLSFLQRGLTDIMAMNAHRIENHAILAGLRVLMLPQEEDRKEHCEKIADLEKKMDELDFLLEQHFSSEGDAVQNTLSKAHEGNCRDTAGILIH